MSLSQEANEPGLKCSENADDIGADLVTRKSTDSGPSERALKRTRLDARTDDEADDV